MINIYVLGGAVLLAFISGWSVNDWRHDAAMKSATDKIRAEEQIKLDALRVSLDTANAERLSLAADLAIERANIKIKYRTITQEVPTYVPPNTNKCNYDLDPGLVSLLNSAAAGGIGYSRSTVESAGQRIGDVSRQPGDIADK